MRSDKCIKCNRSKHEETKAKPQKAAENESTLDILLENPFGDKEVKDKPQGGSVPRAPVEPAHRVPTESAPRMPAEPVPGIPAESAPHFEQPSSIPPTGRNLDASRGIKWSCEHCTFENEPNVYVCDMCGKSDDKQFQRMSSYNLPSLDQ